MKNEELMGKWDFAFQLFNLAETDEEIEESIMMMNKYEKEMGYDKPIC